MIETIPMNNRISKDPDAVSILSIDLETGEVRTSSSRSTESPAPPKKFPIVQIDDVGTTREEPPTKKFPIFITLVSLLQVFLFYSWRFNIVLYFCYDPYRRYELWRFFTEMLVHVSWLHLWGNIVLQVILGCSLEVVHHWKRIAIVYMSGVVGGSLASTIFEPQSYGFGASAGIYALLGAHFATLILNWNKIDKRCCRLFWLLLYIFVNICLTVYAEFDEEKPMKISHAGHFGGAVAGFIVAVLVLRNSEKHPWERRLRVILGVLMAVLFATVVIINVAWPSHYRKTEWNGDYHETYLTYVLQKQFPQSDPRQLCLQDVKCRRTLIWEFVKAFQANKTTSAI